MKILRRCDICGKFHVEYIVEDARLGKLYLCHACWHARTTPAAKVEVTEVEKTGSAHPDDPAALNKKKESD